VVGYALRRLLWVIPVVIGISFIAFVVVHAAPGSPWVREGRQLSPAQVARLNAQLGLDQPLVSQFVAWLGHMLRGDFGLRTIDRPYAVVDAINRTVVITLQLAGMAFALAIAVGVPLGVIAAVRRGHALGHAATALAIVGMAGPPFVLAALLQMAFGGSDYTISLGRAILPATGWESPRHWILPTLALAGLPMAQIARITGAGMLDTLHADYVRTARSKGVRNALGPLVTIAGPLFAILVAGTIAVEIVFRIPGMGNLYWTAVVHRDYGTVMGITFIYASLIAVANAAVDIAYAAIDPRIRDGILALA
jgi:peptide/nickel transport system permease protein